MTFGSSACLNAFCADHPGDVFLGGGTVGSEQRDELPVFIVDIGIDTPIKASVLLPLEAILVGDVSFSNAVIPENSAHHGNLAREQFHHPLGAFSIWWHSGRRDVRVWPP